MFSAAAWADGIPGDPTVTIKKGGGSPPTLGAGDAQNNPIIVRDGSGVTDFLLTDILGGFSLDPSVDPYTNFLYIEVIPALTDPTGAIFNSEFFTCDPGLAQACFTVSPFPPTPAVEFAFYAPTGVFVPGLDVQVSVPEPGTLLLLSAGLMGLLLFGVKRTKFAVTQS